MPYGEFKHYIKIWGEIVSKIWRYGSDNSI